jgi:ferredoxin--NADP+ reductase
VSTGEFREYPVQAVYRAVGYFGTELVEIPFDEKYGVISNNAGRVVDSEGSVVSGIYATGWIKRGPVGLIGHTKSDAMETIASLIEDRSTWWQPAHHDEQSVIDLLKGKNVQFLGWPEWLKVDATERQLGEDQGRERIKLVDREDFLSAAFEEN